MSDIPDDIMQTARDAARRMTLEVDDDGRPYIPVDDIEEIAKSILDERNRRKDGWQPIETAPKDGTKVLVYTEYGRTFVAAWWEDYDDWRYHYEGYVTKPTHWMPLPEPPITDRQQPSPSSGS